MEKEANDLTLFYLLHLFANPNEELTFPGIINSFQQTFEGYADEKYIAKVLVDNEIGKDSFFECHYKSIRKRLAHLLKYSLKKRTVAFSYRDKKSESLNDFISNEASYKEEIEKLKLKFLTDSETLYKTNENSRVWGFYQLALYQLESDNKRHPKELDTVLRTPEMIYPCTK